MTSAVRNDANRDNVTLQWKCNNAYTAQGFSIERSTDGVNFTQIATVAPTVETYTDQHVGPVRSSTACGASTLKASAPSNVVTAEIHVPAAPVNLQILQLFTQHVEIAWDPNSSDQTGFQIERSSDGTHFSPIATVDAYTTSYVDVRFTSPVYYRVEGAQREWFARSAVERAESQLRRPICGAGHRRGRFAGHATFDNSGTYSVNASGSHIWGTADSFQYLYEPLAGDGEIVARVTGIINTDYWTKAGVMIRADTSAGAANAFMLETGPGHDEPVFQWRPDGGGGTNDSGNHPGGDMGNGPPIWLKLDRVGNTFFGYWSKDDITWHNLGGPQTVNMGSSALVGLALTAHNNGTVANAMFDNVTVTQFNPTPLGAPNTLTVVHIVKYKTNSAVTISWRPGSDNENGFVIERSTNGVNFTPIATTPAGVTTFVDTNTDGNGVPDGTYYYRVKAFATGLADSAYSNVDSVHLTAPGTPLTVDHSGGFANSSDMTASGFATFTPNASPVGIFAGHQDIGSPGNPSPAGSATFNSTAGSYTLHASGSDIWDTADHMHYVYERITGDGSIVARLVSCFHSRLLDQGGTHDPGQPDPRRGQRLHARHA